jgi:hypothetical protein
MALRVQITVSGRLGPSILAAVPGLEASLVPCHDALIMQNARAEDLLELVRSLEAARLEIDRIHRSVAR